MSEGPSGFPTRRRQIDERNCQLSPPSAASYPNEGSLLLRRPLRVGLPRRVWVLLLTTCDRVSLHHQPNNHALEQDPIVSIGRRLWRRLPVLRGQACAYCKTPESLRPTKY